MLRIDFQVSISGQPTVIEHIEFEESAAAKSGTYENRNAAFNEAIEIMKKQIGHDDFEICYWWWLK